MRIQRKRTKSRNTPESLLLFPHARQTFAPEGESPSGKASVASLTIHTAVLIALILGFSSDSPVIRPPRVTLLTESKLTTLSWQRVARSTGGGGGGGAHRLIAASRGQTPPATRIHTFVAPTIVTNPAPRLQVSPTLLDAQPPKIDVQQYGDPRSQSGLLSAGPGWGGIGSGFGPGDGADGKNGYGGGRGDGNVYGMGQLTVAPVLIQKVEPDYTEEARRARYQGQVWMRLVIDRSGTPRNIQVVRSLGMGLDEKAVDAVRQWRFRPGMKDGQVVAVRANAEVTFRLL